MLGCQDFCGHYDWTFHYVRRRWGNAALERLWREAIGADGQRHYAVQAARGGLRGLYDAWTKTGQDECCDWTFTLDEEGNFLRWDMRACPSKGYLTEHDLCADEDYCNHCMGWIIPLLEGVGAELVEHEHNHCGQCWAVIRMRDRPAGPSSRVGDVRDDPRWNHGYLDRWADGQPLPFFPEVSPACDPCELLAAWFSRYERANFSGGCPANAVGGVGTLLMDAAAYVDPRRGGEPAGVLIGQPPNVDLAAVAARYQAVPEGKRPLLLHAFLPGLPAIDFLAAGLPRPVPILPWLIRRGLYRHRPGGPHPTTAEFLALLAAARDADRTRE